MSDDNKALTLIVGAFVVLFMLIAVVAHNTTSGGGTYQYPHTSSYGHYDHDGKFHYFPRYTKGNKYYVVPSKPKSKGFGGFSKSKSFSGGSKRR